MPYICLINFKYIVSFDYYARYLFTGLMKYKIINIMSKANGFILNNFKNFPRYSMQFQFRQT